MKRHWLIRILFILPLLLCIGGWAWSWKHFTWGDYYFHGCSVALNSWSGEFSIGAGWDSRYPDGGRWSSKYMSPNSAILLTDGDAFHPFGFSFGRDVVTGQMFFGVPFWFLIALFSLALVIVWRKTRPKPNPKTAFPVEVE